jgi:putative spermidine/putrescine transport system substrate-binding protein
MHSYRAPRRSALFAGLALASAALLTACGTTSGNPGGGEETDELGEMEGSVSILAWPGYVEDGSNDPAVDWVTPFEEETGCMVESKTYGTSDEAFTLMKTGDYDVVAASGDASLRLVAAGDVAPVNTDLLENYDGIFDFLKMKSWNSVDGVSYGIPHGYGANLLMYNTEVFPEAPTSWSVVFDDAAANSGKVTAYDSPIYIADAALYLMETQPDLGIEDPYALDEDQLAAAVDLLKAQKENVSEYWSDYLKEVQAFKSGDSVIGTTWQVIASVAQSEGAKVEAILPEEGATGWSDTWMISSEAKNPNCGYLWMDYITSPEAQAAVAEYFGEAPANTKACTLTSDKTFCDTYHAEDADYAAQIHYWTTPIEQCLDGRTDVKCTDYGQWTTAWTEIKG